MGETFDLDTIDMFPELPRDPVREDDGPADPVIRALRRWSNKRHRPELERQTLRAAADALERIGREEG